MAGIHDVAHHKREFIAATMGFSDELTQSLRRQHRRILAEQFKIAHNGGERRAQLVRGRGDKLIFELIQLFLALISVPQFKVDARTLKGGGALVGKHREYALFLLGKDVRTAISKDKHAQTLFSALERKPGKRTVWNRTDSGETWRHTPCSNG